MIYVTQITGGLYANVFEYDDDYNEPIDETLPVIKGKHFNKSVISYNIKK